MDLSNRNVWLNVDKPLGISSARVVAIIKRHSKAKKVGHGGTLDVMASGVLPIALNRATKTSDAMMAQRKKYSFQIKWGAFTDSDDSEGDIVEESTARPSLAGVCHTLLSFMGKTSQVPSKFSALKVNGKRAYELARKGVEFELKAREITIYSLKLAKSTADSADFEVECSKGTYVRSLSRDICQKLSVCGHVSELARIAVGDFTIENSINLEKFRNFVDSSLVCGAKIEEARWIKSINSTCNINKDC